jgi:hypothetical protein
MPGSAVATVGVPYTPPAAAASSTSGQIRLEPGTRVVMDENLPTNGGGIDAQWYGSVTSRSSAARTTVELREIKCYVDLAGTVTSRSSGAVDQVIGEDGGPSPAYLGQVTENVFGTIVGLKMECLEAPAGGEPDIYLVRSPTATKVENDSVDNPVASPVLIDKNVDWLTTTVPGYAQPTSAIFGQYLYLITGGIDDAVYTAGKFLLTFICALPVPA